MNRVLIAGLLFSLVIIIGTTSHLTSVLAQVNSSGLANTTNMSGGMTNTSSKDTFTASGKISSLIFVHEKAAGNNTSGMKTTTNNSDAATLSVNAKKFVLSGNWDLKVEDGKPTCTFYLFFLLSITSTITFIMSAPNIGRR